MLFKNAMQRKSKLECTNCPDLKGQLKVADSFYKRAKIERDGVQEELKLTQVALNIQKAKVEKIDVLKEHYAKQKETIKKLKEEVNSLKNGAEDSAQPQNFTIHQDQQRILKFELDKSEEAKRNLEARVSNQRQEINRLKEHQKDLIEMLSEKQTQTAVTQTMVIGQTA